MIFQTPAALLLYLAAVGCALFERFTKSTKGVMTLFSAFLAAGASVILILFGGSLWEAAALMTAFLLTELGMGVKK